jgi:hypothetical protein
MSISNKNDLKIDLPPRLHRDLHLYEPASQPDATGYSVAEPDTISANASPFARDYSAEHMLAAIPAKSTGTSASSAEPHVPGTHEKEKR